jgi:hypothetical protein
MNEPPTTAEDVVQLTQRLHAFFGHLDECRFDELTAMFLPEGRWLRQGQWLAGREAILAAMRARPATVRVRHVISNVVVTRRSADEADVQAYMTAYRRLEGQAPALFSINMVGNVFRRQAGGWMLAEQQLVRDFEFGAA